MIIPASALLISVIVHAPEMPPSCAVDAVRFCPYTLTHRTPFTVRGCLSAHFVELAYQCKKDLLP